MTSTETRPNFDPALGWYQIGYLALPPDLPFEAWQECGAHLERWENNVQLWRGDWWRYGEHRYGERAAQAAGVGLKVKTLLNEARVAEQIEPARRRDDLSYSHHEAVSRRPPSEQDRLLSEAAEKGWPVERLRSEVRHLRLVDDQADRDEGYMWQWICVTCDRFGAPDAEGPHFDCPRPTEASFDRYAVCTWLSGHQGLSHEVHFLGQEHLAARTKAG